MPNAPNSFYVEPASLLPAFNSGVRGYEVGQQMQQRNLLREVGQVAANEGLDAASKRALAGGDVATGVKLSELSLDRQMRLHDFLGRAATAADTPEKWQHLTQVLSKQFGPESLRGFENFSSRESAILLSGNALKHLEMQMRERELRIKEKQAEEKPQYQKITDPSGSERLVEIAPYGRGIKDVTPGGNAPQNNPFSTGKMNEAQSKDALYASRMITSEKVLRDPKVVEASLSLAQRGMGKIPVAGNFMVSGDYQKFDQAQRDFINATLRRESGAVISEPEFENARKQYFPQPGDTKDRIAQKQANREEAIRGIAAGAGPNYKPPDALKDLGMVPGGAPAAKQGPVAVSTKAERDALPPGTQYVAPDGTVRTKN
jgi:hypothetical protein